MKLGISQIFKRGIPNEERLSIKVLADVNLSYYAVFDTVYSTPQSISSTPKGTYWFASKLVKAGDLVVLYSKEGVPSEKKREDGSTVYFFYWNKKSVLWDKTGNCAVLVEMASWQTSPYE